MRGDDRHRQCVDVLLVVLCRPSLSQSGSGPKGDAFVIKISTSRYLGSFLGATASTKIYQSFSHILLLSMWTNNFESLSSSYLLHHISVLQLFIIPCSGIVLQRMQIINDDVIAHSNTANDNIALSFSTFLRLLYEFV